MVILSRSLFILGEEGIQMLFLLLLCNPTESIMKLQRDQIVIKPKNSLL